MGQKRLPAVTAIALLAVLAWGCGDDPTCADCPPGDDHPVYLPQTSPENVINNLRVSYLRREIGPYAKLLAPDFRFYFQSADIPPGLPCEYWNRDEDSTGTGALFGATTEVSNIFVDLGAFTVEDSVRVEDPGVKRIRLTHVKLEVELFNGTHCWCRATLRSSTSARVARKRAPTRISGTLSRGMTFAVALVHPGGARCAGRIRTRPRPPKPQQSV